MGRQDWRTPPSVFAALGAAFGGFDTDVAADEHNHLCERWLCDGLTEPWGASNWCNPPFGDISPWVARALAHNGQTVMLVPANTSSPWFQRAIHDGRCSVYAPSRRIAFWHPAEAPGSPDRDTLVLLFGSGTSGVIRTIDIPEHGAEVRRLWEEARGQAPLFQVGALL